MHTMQQTHAQVCTRAYISKQIPERPQKKLCKQTVHGPAAHSVLWPLPPPTVGCCPQAKPHPKILL